MNLDSELYDDEIVIELVDAVNVNALLLNVDKFTKFLTLSIDVPVDEIDKMTFPIPCANPNKIIDLYIFLNVIV